MIPASHPSQVTVQLGRSERDGVVEALRSAGHVPDERVSCRVCRALAKLEGSGSVERVS